jgi:hypothetical protein
LSLVNFGDSITAVVFMYSAIWHQNESSARQREWRVIFAAEHHLSRRPNGGSRARRPSLCRLQSLAWSGTSPPDLRGAVGIDRRGDPSDGFLLLFVGLVVVVPILAHSSWHLNRKVVEPAGRG